MKHYVYSARTTEEGLILINKARGSKGWDSFINEAICAYYNLDPATVNLPPSKFLAEREERRKVREAEKAVEKKAEEKTKKAAKKITKEAKENGK